MPDNGFVVGHQLFHSSQLFNLLEHKIANCDLVARYAMDIFSNTAINRSKRNDFPPQDNDAWCAGQSGEKTRDNMMGF